MRDITSTVACLRRAAEVHLLNDQLDRADAAYQTALSLAELQLGFEHPNLIPLLESMAALCWLADRNAEARLFANRAMELRDLEVARARCSGQIRQQAPHGETERAPADV